MPRLSSRILESKLLVARKVSFLVESSISVLTRCTQCAQIYLHSFWRGLVSLEFVPNTFACDGVSLFLTQRAWLAAPIPRTETNC